VWSSAAAAHLLQGSTCSAFLGWNERLFEEFLLPSYHLEPVGPFSSDINEAFSLNIFSFSDRSL